MRNFDLRNVYFDADGNRFYGKIFFTEKDTSGGRDMPNLKPIYEADGETQLANPIYSTIEGVTSQQVFLDNGAYSVWLYKYVGNGDMSTDTDEEHWEKVNFTPFNVEDPIEGIALAISSKALLQVANIEELRETGSAQIPLTSDGKRLVMLMGYEFAGDKRPVVYSLVSSSDTDNGGSVISSADSGYKWILIDNGESYVDVADFGVFADLQEDTNVSQISKAIAYANNSKKAVHFNKGQYQFNGGNYNVYNDIILDGSTFSFKSGTTTNIDCLHLKTSSRQIFYGDGTINFKADDIRLGWKNSNASNINLTARKNFYVDANYTFNVSDVDVWLILAPHSAGGTFTRCVIHGEGKLDASGTYTFVGGRFTDRYYSSPFAVSTSRVNLTNCTLDINDFSLVSNWFYANVKVGNVSLDFQGKGFDSDFVLPNGPDYTLINGTFLHKVTFSPSVSSDLNLLNCTFSSLAVGGIVGTLAMRSCVVTLGSNIFVSAIAMYDTMVYGSSYYIEGSSKTRLFSCEIEGNVGVNEGGSNPISLLEARDTIFHGVVFAYNTNVRQCQFDSSLNTYAKNNSIQFDVSDCLFTTNASHIVRNSANDSFAGVWKGNRFSTTSTGINIQNYPDANSCYYEYEGNTGNVFSDDLVTTLSVTPTYEVVSGTTFDDFVKCSLTIPRTNFFAVGYSRLLITLDFEFIGSSIVPFSSSYSFVQLVSNSKGQYEIPQKDIAFNCSLDESVASQIGNQTISMRVRKLNN